MISRYLLGELELKGDRLYLIHTAKGFRQRVDVTPLWHMFNDIKDFSKNPIPPDQECSCDEQNKEGCSSCPKDQL